MALQTAQAATNCKHWRPCSPPRRPRLGRAAHSGHRCPQASAEPQQAAPAAQAAAADRAAVPVTFLVGGDEITVQAQPGQNIWELSNEAGAYITLGCSQGSCGVCEVEVWKYSSGSSTASTGVVRACIAGVPPGYERLEVREVPEDDIWGVDGYDT
ncbi:hypothetical protein ABPG77_000057 [Micractinium sp. CCAP 211/92]